MKLRALLLLLLPPVLFASTKPAPNPADYGLTLHVVSSVMEGPVGGIQALAGVLGGECLTLEGRGSGVLLPGDYKVRAVGFDQAPKHQNGYEVYRAYKILLPGGDTHRYQVYGISSDTGNCTIAPRRP